jgi:uncharacterized protein
MILKSEDRNRQVPSLYHGTAWSSGIALMVLGTMIVGSAPAVAWDGSSANAPRRAASKGFASAQQALRVGVDDLRAGKIESSVAALNYAATLGQVIARWKLGELYAVGDGVSRDDFKAYHYFNRIVEDYNEDQPDQQNLSAISDAFVAVGVYCLHGLPTNNIPPDPRRAHELFQYAATTFNDPNAQYNLAHMYMIGAGGVAKDHVAAVRWLALAAKAGHRPSEALLGHMLFVGDGVLDQRAQGLMWLELAQDGASNPKDQWIHDLYQHDFQVADYEDRQAAATMREARAKGLPPLPGRSRIESFLESFGAPPPTGQ